MNVDDDCENCQGMGSVLCDYCDSDGCWACNQTGVVPCDYCDPRRHARH